MQDRELQDKKLLHILLLLLCHMPAYEFSTGTTIGDLNNHN